MTPEERFTKIENFLNTTAELQARHEERFTQMEERFTAVESQIQTLASATRDLTGVSRHLVTIQGELIESNSLLRQMVESHAKRLEYLEDRYLNG